MLSNSVASQRTLCLLGITLALLPALGVPSELMLQDSFKSALLALGTLAAAVVFFSARSPAPVALRGHWVLLLPLALTLYALGSMVWAQSYLAGVKAVRWLLLGLLLWLLLNTLERTRVAGLLMALHLGATLAALWAVLQFCAGLTLFPQGAAPASTFVNRNFLAEYLVCVLPLSVWLLACQRSVAGRLGMGVSLVLLLTALLMTGTRSALLALLLLALLLPLLLWRYRRAWGLGSWSRRSVLALLLLLAGVAALGSLPTRDPQILGEARGVTALERSWVRSDALVALGAAGTLPDASLAQRGRLWRATWRMLAAQPWSGVGAGSWEVQIPRFQDDATMSELDFYAHNEVLQLLSEYGLLVGGAVLAFALAFGLQRATAAWRLPPEADAVDALAAFSAASLLALGLVANAGFPLHLAGTGALLALNLALLARADTAGLRSWHGQGSARAAGRALCACALLAAGAITLQAGRAEYWLVHATHLSNRIDQGKAGDGEQLADCYAQMAQALRTGMALNPQYRQLLLPLGDFLARHGRNAEAVAVWQTVAQTRPHIAALWSNLAERYAAMGQTASALAALAEVQRLKPQAPQTRVLQVVVLSRTGNGALATALLNSYFDRARYDYDLVETAYYLGRQTHNPALALRALALRNHDWPQQAAEGYWRMGQIYAERGDGAGALQAFRAGLLATPVAQQAAYRARVPPPWRAQL